MTLQQENHNELNCKYKSVFERAPIATLLADGLGRIVGVNAAGVRLLGYEDEKEVLASVALGDILDDPGDVHRLQQEKAGRGFADPFETRMAAKGGRKFFAEVSSCLIVEGENQPPAYAFFIRDVDEKKHIEKRIQHQNERLAALNAICAAVSRSLDLETLLNRTIDKIIEILKPDSVRIYLLDEKRENLELAAFKGLSERFIEKGPYRSRRVGVGYLGEVAKTGKTLVVGDLSRSESPYVDSMVEEGLQTSVYIPLVCKKETVGVMPVSSHTELRFSADQIDFLSAIGSQIGMAVHNAHLYESLKKAYAELNVAQELVVRTEKLASLGKLAATIAHEINNPLTAVLTYVRLMKKLADRGGFAPERVKDIGRYLQTMESETARCGEIVKNLLAFARHSSTHKEPCDMASIVEKTLTLFAHELEMKGITVRKSMEAGLPSVRCDFRQMQQAILNLLSNAAEAMTKGGVLSIDVRRSSEPGQLEVIVSDTGCGIPKEHLARIFEPFFTTKEEGKGVGLGLSVVYGIVAGHNGVLDVSSTLGEGTRFRIMLPNAS